MSELVLFTKDGGPLNKCIATLRDGLPADLRVVTKASLNGAAHNIIARTGDDIRYRPGQPGFALFDYDQKGMPGHIACSSVRLSIASLVLPSGWCSKAARSWCRRWRRIPRSAGRWRPRAAHWIRSAPAPHWMAQYGSDLKALAIRPLWAG